MTPKPTLVHLIISLNSGGCENMLLRTLPHLADDYNQVVVTLRERGELADEMERRGIPVVTIGLKHLFDRAGRARLLTEVQRIKPSLIMTYLVHADFIGRLFLQSRSDTPVVPFLRTTHNYPRYWPALIFEWLTQRYVTHYLACSDSIKDYYHRVVGVDNRRITVIPNGLDLATFSQTSHVIKQELAIAEGALVVTCVANLAKNKGHAYLLKAFDALWRTHQDAVLLIVGKGAERANLEAQIKDYPSKKNIHFLGRRNDVPNILGITDIFVLPTLFEGMSNAILEAMAAKCAVITTDIPENRVIVRHNETGILVPVKNSDAIVQALEKLAGDAALRQRLGGQAHRFIAEHFTLEAVIALWKKAIEAYRVRP